MSSESCSKSAGCDGSWILQRGHSCEERTEEVHFISSPFVSTHFCVCVCVCVKEAGGQRRTLVDLTGLLWFDWCTTSLTIILAICQAISSWALTGRVKESELIMRHGRMSRRVLNAGERHREPQTAGVLHEYLNVLLPHLIGVALHPFLHRLRKHGTYNRGGEGQVRFVFLKVSTREERCPN